MMANTENIRKWVDALRSGDYRQGRGSLFDGQSYCCLGVACEISNTGQWNYTNYGQFEYETPFGSDYAVLPKGVSQWLDIPPGNPQVGGIRVAARNDGEDNSFGHRIKRHSFSEIADLIEAEWLSDEPA